jgi:hypothetical protein
MEKHEKDNAKNKKGNAMPSSVTREDKLEKNPPALEERRRKSSVDKTPETGPGGE